MQRMEFKLPEASGIYFMDYWRRGSCRETSSKNLQRCSSEPIAKYQAANKCGEISQGWEKSNYIGSGNYTIPGARVGLEDI